ncbi:unnamed protein product [Toxocara canis]|uniref:Uncharacterized protein n=1 Tax=Toxocara canis TaxID=6265 RepID=A0A183UTY6_TOXCA|nr:unnamed protein product [Toxocara canis]
MVVEAHECLASHLDALWFRPEKKKTDGARWQPFNAQLWAQKQNSTRQLPSRISLLIPPPHIATAACFYFRLPPPTLPTSHGSASLALTHLTAPSLLADIC